MTLRQLQARYRPKKELIPKIEIGDYVVLLVPPAIKGVVINTYKGKYEDEVTLNDPRWGLVIVGARYVRKLKEKNPDYPVYGDNSEEKVA